MATHICLNGRGFVVLRRLAVNLANAHATAANSRTSNMLIRDSFAVRTRLTSHVTNASKRPADEDKSAAAPILLSDSCIQRLKSIQSDNESLRIAVDGGGCSGFQYAFNMDSTVNPDDKIIEKDGARIIVDEISLGFLNGSIIDYHEELIRSAFRVKQNPNADNGCSCGASFSVKG